MVHEDEADGEPVVQVACWEGALEHTPTVQDCGENGRDAGWRVKEALKDMYVCIARQCWESFTKSQHRNNVCTFYEGLCLLR